MGEVTHDGLPHHEGKLRLATEKEGDRYYKQAEKWLESTNGVFHDCESHIKVAITEYIANKHGVTVYPSRAEQENG